MTFDLQSHSLVGVENAQIHLSDGTTVFLARNTSGAVELWHSADRSTTAQLVVADVGMGAAGILGATGLLLARDASDNLFILSRVGTSQGVQGGRARAYVKGAGYTWSARAILIPAGTPAITDLSAQMVWCATGGGLNGAGHLVMIGASSYRSIDAGVLLAGSGTPTSVGGSHESGSGPWGSDGALEVKFVGDATSEYRAVDVAPDGFGATSGVAVLLKTDASNQAANNTFVGRWQVSSAGAFTFAPIAPLGVTAWAPTTTSDAAYVGNAQLRVARLGPNRWAVVTSGGSVTVPQGVPLSTGEGHRHKVTLISGTAVLGSSALNDPQITNWPYPHTAFREWDVAVDVARQKVWLYANGRGGDRGVSGTLYRLGAQVTGSVVAWDSAATVDNPTFGAESSSSPNRASIRVVRFPVNSTADFVVRRGNGAGLRGSSTIYNQAPYAPTGLQPNNNAPVDRTAPQILSWVFSDPDAGDSPSAYDLRHGPVGTDPTTWTLLTAITPNSFREFPAAAFPAGNREWQVRTRDSVGELGPWSASAFFAPNNPPAGPAITAPVSGTTLEVANATLTWSTTQQEAYEVRRVADSGGVPDEATIYQAAVTVVDATTRSVALTFDVNARAEHLQVRTRYLGLWSPWA